MLRTQRVLANETDVTASVDPLAGSYLIESMTDATESAVDELMNQVDELGERWPPSSRAFRSARSNDRRDAVAKADRLRQRVVVGVNRYVLDTEEPYDPLRVDPAIEVAQRDRLGKLRAERDATAVDKALDGLVVAATGASNVLYPMKDALRARATVGEVCDALRSVWGTYRPPDTFGRQRPEPLGSRRAHRFLLLTAHQLGRGVGAGLSISDTRHLAAGMTDLGSDLAQRRRRASQGEARAVAILRGGYHRTVDGRRGARRPGETVAQVAKAAEPPI